MPAVQGTLIAPTRNHRAQTPVGKQAANRGIAVSLISYNAVWEVAWSARARASDLPGAE